MGQKLKRKRKRAGVSRFGLGFGCGIWSGLGDRLDLHSRGPSPGLASSPSHIRPPCGAPMQVELTWKNIDPHTGKHSTHTGAVSKGPGAIYSYSYVYIYLCSAPVSVGKCLSTHTPSGVNVTGSSCKPMQLWVAALGKIGVSKRYC